MSCFHLFDLTLPISSCIVKMAAVYCNNSGQHLKNFKNQHAIVLSSLVQLILKICLPTKDQTGQTLPTRLSRLRAERHLLLYHMD